MTFLQLRITSAVLLIAAVLVSLFTGPITPLAIVFACVSAAAAVWISYWLPVFLVEAQDKYGLR